MITQHMRRSGQALVEYSFTVAFVAFAAVLSMTTLSTTILSLLGTVINALK